MPKYKSDNLKYPTSNKLNQVFCFEIITTTWPNDGMPTNDQQRSRTMAELKREFRMSQREEIVGIGISCVVFGENIIVHEPTVILVSPKLSEVSDKTLVSLAVDRQTFENHAVPLLEAMWQMRAFGADAGSLPVWACWGDFPARKIKRDCERVKARHPFSSRMINTKVIASLVINQGVDLSMSQIGDEADLTMFVDDARLKTFNDGSRDIYNNTSVSSGILGWCLS
tara:strand:- start:356 stop:1033 length:678 start_codon:yes stop_codon:yes gene_type:complete